MSTDLIYLKPSELEGKPIPPHDGVDVTEVSITLSLTGNVIKDAMEIKKMHLPMGSRLILMLPVTVVSHEYDMITEGTGKNKIVLEDEYAETAVLQAEGVIFADPGPLLKVVADYNAKIAQMHADEERSKKEARGEFELPSPVGDPTEEPVAQPKGSKTKQATASKDAKVTPIGEKAAAT